MRLRKKTSHSREKYTGFRSEKNTDFEGESSENLSVPVTVSQESPAENEFATFSERDNNLEDICNVKSERMKIRDLGFRIN